MKKATGESQRYDGMEVKFYGFPLFGRFFLIFFDFF
jgi:hypothetical protein